MIHGGGVPKGRSETASDAATGGNTSAAALYNTNPQTSNAAYEGGIGQSVIGTFTADSSGSQSIFFSAPTGDGQLNALQLRAVPEPTSLALFGLAALGICTRRRSTRIR